MSQRVFSDETLFGFYQLADLPAENVLHKKYVRGKQKHDFVTNSMLWELSQRIFSNENLYGADSGAKNDLRMLMRGANKGKIPSKSLYREKYLSVFSSGC